MSNLPANPLQNILKQAAQTLPAITGKVAIQQERIDRRRGQVVVLADVSASMGGPAAGDKRKIDVLREAIASATQNTPARLFVFSATTREVQSVPEPENNTNLAQALREVQRLDPGVTLVISDGQPDNARAALDVASTFRGAIDVLYIGNDKDYAAISFMQQLAKVGGGDVRVHDVARLGNAQQLIAHIAGLLQ